jgi:hypothetical protein
MIPGVLAGVDLLQLQQGVPPVRSVLADDETAEIAAGLGQLLLQKLFEAGCLARQMPKQPLRYDTERRNFGTQSDNLATLVHVVLTGFAFYRYRDVRHSLR